MLQGKNYRAIDMAFPIVCGSINHLTKYTKPAKMTRVYAIYSPLMSKVVPGNW